jgi:hypothetical protein
MTANERRRPPELVGASQRPVRLAGAAASVTAVMAPTADPLLDRAARPVAPEAGGSRAYLNVEDIRALSNPGVVYGVYLNLPRRWTERDRDLHHVGNVTTFGIEGMNSLDPKHDHVPGFRHTFDVTRRLRVLRRLGRIKRGEPLEVSFLPELPVPPPGYRGDAKKVLAEILDNARGTPIVVGRVSVFVG